MFNALIYFITLYLCALSWRNSRSW